MKTKGWRIKEKVVAIIEKSLDKKALVLHDIKLPVINSPSGRKRQCDVVIIQGEDPRKTTSIVEVQKRKSKPNINDFNGWLEKKNEVGAQHLICVSEKGFSNSIKEKADKIGPTVRLITLKELENNKWPNISLRFQSKITKVPYDRLSGLEIHYIHLVRKDPNRDYSKYPDPHEKCFRTPTGEIISPTDYMDFHLFANPKNLEELPIKENFALKVVCNWDNTKDSALEHLTDFQDWVKIKKLEILMELSISQQKIDWSASNYEQLGWGELGWVLRGKNKDTDVIVPLKKIKPGEYRMSDPINLSNIATFISIGNQGYRVIPFETISGQGIKKNH